MKPSLQRFLVCPSCHSELRLQVRRFEGDEIMEGFFRCSCGVTYPIIRGVPRMLPSELLASLEDDYPEFFAESPTEVESRERARDQTTITQRRTQEAFGYEWTWAIDYHADNFADWLPDGLGAAELFRGRVGLEVGCGAGRHAAETAAVATEHVAVDLSRAVDVAFDHTKRLPNCHVVQADAFHLPFRERTFDYVYCLGVLQHMPDPEGGFLALAKQPRQGGILVANVYQASRPVVFFMLETARKVTTRLPHSLLKYISIATGCLDYAVIAPWRWLRPTWVGRLFRPLVPERVNEYANHDFHTCVTDWFDRLSCPMKKHYKREDMVRWYEMAGYSDVTVTPFWKAFWNGYGRRLAA
jgi:SAM-dependent methyltransferase/uncharacterized protein YbaR (Trm112 family)